jgi:hypothetical protein
VCVALGAAGCAPSDVPIVPSGPPAVIGLQIAFFVDVLGTWTADGFADSLRSELSKYGIDAVTRRPLPPCVARITLGAWTDRSSGARPGWWGDGSGAGARSIEVDLFRDGHWMKAGQIRVPDLSMTTLDVAAEYVAVIVARAVRQAPAAPPNDGGTDPRHAGGT